MPHNPVIMSKSQGESQVTQTYKYAPLAQLVEHLTLNQGVQGSSPWWCTKKREYRKILFFNAKNNRGSNPKGPDSPVDCLGPSTAEPSAGRQTRSVCESPWWCTKKREYRKILFFNAKNNRGSNPKGPDSPVDCLGPSTAEPSAGRQTRSVCESPWWCTNVIIYHTLYIQ